MKHLIFALTAICFLYSCKNNEPKPAEDRTELMPEPDKDLREADEENKVACAFTNPDTSVAGIKIRNVESVIKTLGNTTSLEGAKSHLIYSNDKKQLLGLTVHPGDMNNQVSIFRVSYSDDSKQNYPSVKSKTFISEKGIELGMNKASLIEKIGTCYVATDSTANGMTLTYSLELPNDSHSGLLKNNNMPLYFAKYVLQKDKVVELEFGFENP